MKLTPGVRLLALMLALLLVLGAGWGLFATAVAAETEDDDADNGAEEDEPEADEPEVDEAEDDGGLSAEDVDVTIINEPDTEGTLSAGDEVTYSIEVTVEGADLPDAFVVHALPAGFQHVSAEPEGELSGNEIIWTQPFEDGDTHTFTHTVEAGTGEEVEGGQLVEVEHPDAPEAPSDTEVQFTSSVCVGPAQGQQLLGCQEAWQTVDREADEGTGVLPWIIGGAVVLLLVLAAAIYYFLVLRPKSQAQAEQPEDEPAEV
ncbi:DUF11 domain-containing protein [Nesterenkonia alba]|uniref:DUF11 domain-containing protein n=1 Tax=Nesterenkonia alba TaxID=515814 RepID=UPI0003B4D8A3|nr:DUF11 domain-containing protein [Nesterenkonia alba]